MNGDDRRLDWLLLAALISFAGLPWYRIRGGFFAFDRVTEVAGDARLWPGLLQLF